MLLRMGIHTNMKHVSINAYCTLHRDPLSNLIRYSFNARLSDRERRVILSDKMLKSGDGARYTHACCPLVLYGIDDCPIMIFICMRKLI